MNIDTQHKFLCATTRLYSLSLFCGIFSSFEGWGGVDLSALSLYFCFHYYYYYYYFVPYTVYSFFSSYEIIRDAAWLYIQFFF